MAASNIQNSASNKEDQMVAESAMTEIKRRSLNPIDACYFSDSDGVDLFNIYLEFILYWTRSDAESYRNAAAMVMDREGKELLLSMAGLKTEMFRAFSAYHSDGKKDWFASAFGGVAPRSTSSYMLDNDFKPIQRLRDVFNFAYRKEYQGLATFEKLSRADKDPIIRSLLENAAGRQRQHILYLDTRLACAGRISERQDPVIAGRLLESRV
jgi:hypothetical protein